MTAAEKNRIRKIGRMWEYFGISPGRICGECKHFTYPGQNAYHKCDVYGRSSSASTDWNVNWEACGAFDKDVKERNMMKYFNGIQKRPAEPCEGQMSFFMEE